MKAVILVSTSYVSGSLGVSRSGEWYHDFKRYLKVDKLSHDGLIQGTLCYGYVDGQNQEPLEFSVFDYELGLPGWASEQLVKQVHLNPYSAGDALFKGSSADRSRESMYSLGRDNAWFSISRSDRGSVYEVKPLFDKDGLSDIIGSKETYRENPPGSHRFEVVHPAERVQFEAGLDKELELYDAVLIRETILHKEQLQARLSNVSEECKSIESTLRTL